MVMTASASVDSEPDTPDMAETLQVGDATPHETTTAVSGTAEPDSSPSPADQVEEDMLIPHCFGRFIVRCPFLLCGIMLLILLLVTIIDATVFELSAQSDRLFLVETNEYVEAFDAYNLAGQEMADNAASNLTVL